MELNWNAVLVTLLGVMVMFCTSWFEGTLTKTDRQSVDISFMLHGGMWGDLLLLPFVNGLLFNHVKSTDMRVVIVCAIIALILTCAMHKTWYDPSYKGHMWFKFNHHSWWKDLSLSGWSHVVFMTGIATMLFLYICCNPAPPSGTVSIIATLLLIHWCIGIIQPSYVITGTVDKLAINTYLAVGAITVVITIEKLFQAMLLEKFFS